MASTGGARPTGTDGNDFRHREQVASHYEKSAQTKSYVRFAVYMQGMISILVLIQLGLHHTKDIFKISNDFFPEPQNWQYLWILSLVPSILGYFSLGRNRTNLLKIYYYGNIVLGLGPVLCTILFSASDLLQYAEKKKTESDFNGFPLIVLWYIFLFIALQIHALGVYNARVLLKSWNIKKRR